MMNELTTNYKLDVKTYTDTINMTEYLTHLILQAVPVAYINCLQEDHIHGFADVSPTQLVLSHNIASPIWTNLSRRYIGQQ
jgi:hypothetical protein